MSLYDLHREWNVVSELDRQKIEQLAGIYGLAKSGHVLKAEPPKMMCPLCHSTVHTLVREGLYRFTCCDTCWWVPIRNRTMLKPVCPGTRHGEEYHYVQPSTLGYDRFFCAKCVVDWPVNMAKMMIEHCIAIDLSIAGNGYAKATTDLDAFLHPKKREYICGVDMSKVEARVMAELKQEIKHVELQPFSPRRACAKCGASGESPGNKLFPPIGDNHGVKYLPTVDVLSLGNGRVYEGIGPLHQEHLQRTCRNCGYTWPEAVQEPIKEHEPTRKSKML